MVYKEDENLEFLEEIASDDLNPLVGILTKGKDGDERWTEGLTLEDKFIEHQPDHSKYWDLVAAELQMYGGNTLINIARGGKGVLYREILINVCKKMKVNFNKDAKTSLIEMNLLMKILTDSMEKMSAEELKAISQDLDLKTTNFTPQAVAAALQIAVVQSGFMAYQIAVIVANAVAKAILGHGLKLSTNAALTRVIGVFAGPVGWALTAIWTIFDIAGPAYRVTIPAVIQVAFLRLKHQET